ncbi:MAG: DUF3842 family protein [Treponema sp.]|jgi:uncharacterized membrane protein|nr:DUF3842 family protein [Treponema sp.]
MKTTIVVVDGMGGGIGVQIIGKLKEIIDSDTEIIALGTNAVATERMVKAGAHRGATGENAIRVSVSSGDFILGPIGIVIGNSMMGEITRGVAAAVLAAPGSGSSFPCSRITFSSPGWNSFPWQR